jgi:hypothetical protein
MVPTVLRYRQQYNPSSTRVDQHDQTQTKPTATFIRQDCGKEKINTLTTNSSSRYFDTAIWSPRPLRRRVLRTRSLASACPDAGSSGRSLMLVSVGSPWQKASVFKLGVQKKGQRSDLERLTNGQTFADRMLDPESPFADPSRIH